MVKVKNRGSVRELWTQNRRRRSVMQNPDPIYKIITEAKFLQNVEQIRPLDPVECHLGIERKPEGQVLAALGELDDVEEPPHIIRGVLALAEKGLVLPNNMR